RMRQLSAAGCGACEAELNALGNVVFDIGRFGMGFTASPRHADALVVTGPVPRNMRDALRLCVEAVPEPKVVIAVGACAISGGLFRSLPASPNIQEAEGIGSHIRPDLFIPGCPPHPYTVMDGLLRFIGRIP
ncbi:MAG: hydrogenase, partial [Desulfovibrio sp.]|nr:hydrogenase [Desulfovibrio sp.]